ncbi:hypothetical protein Hanom_Chr04g00297861 [Helianthus anomalus]
MIKCYMNSKFCRPYKFLVHCVIHALAHRKGAYDEASDYIMNIISSLVLNRTYNISQVIFNHMLDNIKGERYVQGVKPEDEQRYRQKFTKIKKPDYVAPEGDNWRHPDSNSDNETQGMKPLILKKLRWWFVKDEKKKRTLKVSTPKVVIKGKTKKQESPKRLVDNSFEYFTKNVNVCVAETKKKKSPPRLVDEPVIPPTDVIKEGVDLLKMSFANYEKLSTAQGAQDVTKTGDNVGASGENVKETFIEGQVHTDLS